MSEQKFNGAVRLLSDETKAHYNQHIQQWQQSSLSQARYCEENNLNPHTFYYLRSKYLQAQRPFVAKEKLFVEAKTKQRASSNNHLSNSLTLHLNNTLKLDIPMALTATELAKLFHALGVIS